MIKLVAVVGGSGFVGRQVVERLGHRSVAVRTVRAPRIRMEGPDAPISQDQLDAHIDRLTPFLSDASVIINCAGNPNASSRDLPALFGANAALPLVIREAASRVGADRLVHVSSAVVQGSSPTLDASTATGGSTAYAKSKIAGEQVVLDADGLVPVVVYRPPSVHGADRRVTRSIRRLARSPLSSVVGPGDRPTPQAHILNVAEAICELALCDEKPPSIVIHPSEGWTTAGLMRTFGDGKEPLHIPNMFEPLLRSVLQTLQRSPQLAANARRVEMMWFGQGQAQSWLTTRGWTPPVDRRAWRDMFGGIDAKADTMIGSDSDGD